MVQGFLNCSPFDICLASVQSCCSILQLEIHFISLQLSTNYTIFLFVLNQSMFHLDMCLLLLKHALMSLWINGQDTAPSCCYLRKFFMVLQQPRNSNFDFKCNGKLICVEIEPKSQFVCLQEPTRIVVDYLVHQLPCIFMT